MVRREVPGRARESMVRGFSGIQTTGSGRRRSAGYLLGAVIILCLFATPAMAGVALFHPSSSSIASTGVMDMAEGWNGEIYFATDAGLSFYREGWTTLHTFTPLANGSLLSNHVLAVETDDRGSVWVGYPNGLQVFSGRETVTVQDQQLLKNLNVNALQRVGKDMWVATGSAGAQRWRNGAWHRFVPWGEEGLGAYDIQSMAQDRITGVLYLATADNGIWVVDPGPDPLQFYRILGPVVGDPVVREVRGDTFGGVYLFNRSTVLHHSLGRGFSPVLNASDLGEGDLFFFDLAVAGDGAVWIASDNGIYVLTDGRVTRHLTMHDGLDTNAVKRIFPDHQGRVWFVTTGAAGYFPESSGTPIPLTVKIVQTPAAGTPDPGTMIQLPPTPVIDVEVIPGPAGSTRDPLSGFLSGLNRWLAGLLGRKG